MRGLVPIGLGTPWVESLSGLLIRTARAHQLTLRRFAERVAAEVAGDPETPGWRAEDLAAYGRELVKGASPAVNGGWGTAQTWVEILSSATLQPRIAETTLLPWADRLSNRELLGAYRRYCPVCLYEWNRDGLTPYEPLRWQLLALEACVEHRVRLRDTCPTAGCGRKRAVTAGWASTSRCVGCRAFLGRPVEEVGDDAALTAEDLDWAAFVDRELGDLLAQPPARDEIALSRFPEALAIAVASVSNGRQRDFAERIGMTEASVSYWKDGSRRPSLMALLRVARAAGFGLRDLMTGNVAALEESSAPTDVPYVAPSRETHRVLDKKLMERVLRSALTTDPPPTLTSLYRDLRVDAGHVRRTFPQLCRDIRERREAYEAQQLAERRAGRVDLLIHAISRLHEHGTYPSKNQLQKILPREIHFQHDYISAAWRSELKRLGWGDPSDLCRVKGAATPQPKRREALHVRPIMKILDGHGTQD